MANEYLDDAREWLSFAEADLIDNEPELFAD